LSLDKALERAVARLGKFRSEAAGLQLMPKLLAEQHLNVWFIIDHENQEFHRSYPITVNVTRPVAAPPTCSRSVHWPWRKAVYQNVITGTVVPNNGMPGRIRTIEKLTWIDFIVSAVDRDMPFPLLYVSIVNRVGVGTVTA
jgi:hypothetical protein